MDLTNILKQNKCFKLVCGAGNEDAVEVEKLVALYSHAGACYFDLSARQDVILSARSGLQRTFSKITRKDCFLNVSVGIKGDPHISKASINIGLCIKCGKCKIVCLQRAIIFMDNHYSVHSIRCIGCGTCIKECQVNAISRYFQVKPLDEVLKPLVTLGIDSIEFHAVSADEEAVQEQWKTIEQSFEGILSICIDRSELGDKQLINRIKKMINNRNPYTTIVQADGAPMSGSDDLPETTLQAIACAKLVQDSKLPVFLLLSGGTNSKTTKLSKIFNVKAHGVSIGSFARKIVYEFISQDDFFNNNEIYNKALTKARWLVSKSLNSLG